MAIDVLGHVRDRARQIRRVRSHDVRLESGEIDLDVQSLGLEQRLAAIRVELEEVLAAVCQPPPDAGARAQSHVKPRPAVRAPGFETGEEPRLVERRTAFLRTDEITVAAVVAEIGEVCQLVLAPDDEAQLHHFVADSPWNIEPLEEVLLQQVDSLRVSEHGGHPDRTIADT